VTFILSVFPLLIIAQAGRREGTSKEREVFKAVLMHIAKQSKGGTANDILYFVSVNDGDPPESFLDELRKNGLNARKESDLKIEDALDKNQRDANTHMRAISLSVENLRWLSEAEVEVSGGYWKGSRRFDSGAYHASYLVDKWKVTKFHRLIVHSIE